jgi:hypothetical protein
VVSGHWLPRVPHRPNPPRQPGWLPGPAPPCRAPHAAVWPRSKVCWLP